MRAIFIIFFLFALIAQANAQGQTRTKKQVVKAYFANGKLKSVTTTHTTLPKFIDPMNYYRKTKVNIMEYDSLTAIKTREVTRITKIGKDGNPCFELFFEEIKYDEFGHRSTYAMSRCDKKKFVFKQYADGKLVFTRINKRRKRQ